MSQASRRAIRIAQVDEIARERTARISARNAPHFPLFNARLRQVIDGVGAGFEARYWTLIQLADDLTAATQDDVACHRGCSHCCHIAVGVITLEAEAIGKRIGVAPQDVPGRLDFKDISWGYHNPCGFLVGGECSIYAHRPLACRIQYSVAPTEDPCRHIPANAGVGVPYLNLNMFHTAVIQIAIESGRNFALGDIREFWPQGLQTKEAK